MDEHGLGFQYISHHSDLWVHVERSWATRLSFTFKSWMEEPSVSTVVSSANIVDSECEN
jgi:hypothetical protein